MMEKGGWKRDAEDATDKDKEPYLCKLYTFIGISKRLHTSTKTSGRWHKHKHNHSPCPIRSTKDDFIFHRSRGSLLPILVDHIYLLLVEVRLSQDLVQDAWNKRFLLAC